MSPTLFHAEKFYPEQIALTLYDFSQLGVLYIPEFLTEEFNQRLLEEIKSRDHLFKPFTGYSEKVPERLSSFHLGDTDVREHGVKGSISVLFPVVGELLTAYSSLYRELAKKAAFLESSPNSIGVHKYVSGDYISPHLDFSYNVNVISLFTLCGRGRLRAYPLKANPVDFFQEAGSLTLLRAPRTPEEKEYRPRHSIDRIVEERIALVVRQDTRRKALAPEEAEEEYG